MATSPMPKVAMVFAAGLGARMRPITLTLPKPLVEVAGKALIDHCLDRFALAGVERAIVNVHWLADQIEAHLAGRAAPSIVISDERARLLDQGGGIRKALPALGASPFFLCNTDAFWIEGPRSNLARLAAAFDPERMDAALLVATSASAVGVDWPGDFSLDADGRLSAREDRHVAPFVYTGVGIIKPELFAGRPGEIFRLAPFFFAAARRGRLHGVRLDGLWLHVGRPESIAEAERAIDRSTL
ncbi:MAG: nucleotidyltransferase family protein [Roseiarcus sp.]|jgi:MurNAc alpha-1-phosphate uridylyltransferase